MRHILAGVALFMTCLARSASAESDAALVAAVHDSARSPKFVARDAARHPVEELTFFGIKPNQTVVEIWPSGGYWTEILAPYLRDHGRYIAAPPSPKAGSTDPDDTQEGKLKAKFAADPQRYGRAAIAEVGETVPLAVPANSADLIVTFRNLHNWMDGGYAPQMLESFYKALKPGGILGVEEHRKRGEKPQDPKAEDGYVRQDYAIDLIKKAGFELVGSSEINANPTDTTDWPKGVWTLPPTLELGDVDRAKYVAIGEADNFVLKFRKPAKSQ